MAQDKKNNNSKSQEGVLKKSTRLDRFGFYRNYKFLYRVFKLSPNEVSIFGYLDDMHRNETIEEIHVSVPRIAKELNLSPSTVERVIKVLRKHSLLYIIYRPGMTSLWQVNDDIVEMYDNEGKKITNVDKYIKNVDNSVDKPVDNSSNPRQNDGTTPVKMTGHPRQNDGQLKPLTKTSYQNSSKDPSEEDLNNNQYDSKFTTNNFLDKGKKEKRANTTQRIGDILKSRQYG